MLHRWIWRNKSNCNWLINPQGVLCDPRWPPCSACQASELGEAGWCPQTQGQNWSMIPKLFCATTGLEVEIILSLNGRANSNSIFEKLRIRIFKKTQQKDFESVRPSYTQNWLKKKSSNQSDPWVCIWFAIHLMSLKLYEKIKNLTKVSLFSLIKHTFILS